MSIPIFQFIPTHTPSLRSNHKFVFYICNSISILQFKKMLKELSHHLVQWLISIFDIDLQFKNPTLVS